MESSKTAGPAPRIPLEMSVEYRRTYARSRELGTLRNISLTGAFLQSADPTLFPNDKLQVTIKVSGRTRRIQAAVVWKNEKGCGVRFLPASNRDLQIVDDLMYFVEDSRTTRRSVLEDIFKRVG